MKKIVVFTVLFAFIFAGMAFAFKLPGLKGTLKKKEVELKLSDIDPALKDKEGTDMDPFKDKPYKYNVYGDKEFDGFFTSAHKVNAKITYMTYCIADVEKKLDTVKGAEAAAMQTEMENIAKMATSITGEATSLIGNGQKLISSAPNKFKKNPIDLKESGNLVKDLKASVEALSSAGKGAGDVAKKAPALATKLAEKAKEAAAGQ